MQYMLLIYSDEKNAANATEAEQQAVMGRYMTYTEELQKAGVMKAGDALLPTSSATSVRVRSGETITTDGPFAETKEQLGGYYIIDVPNLDEALKWAAKLPGAEYGTVEVRPVMVFE